MNTQEVFEKSTRRGTIEIALDEKGNVVAKKTSDETDEEVNKVLNEILMAYENHLNIRNIIGKLPSESTPSL